MTVDNDKDIPRRLVITLAHDEKQKVTVDAAISMTHNNSADVTKSPVEDGVDTTDHIRRLPKTYTLTGVFSDHPIIQEASKNVDTKSRSIVANAFLDRAIDRGYLINIETRLKSYRGYAILNKRVDEDRETGRIVSFVINIEEIIIATTDQVTAPIPVKVESSEKTNNRNKKRNRGRQNKKKEASDKNKEKSQSLANKLFGKTVQSVIDGGPM